MKVFTAQMSKINRSNPEHMDITVKSGIKMFAPTWDMVMGYKDGRISEEEYTEMYYNLMRQSYRTNREEWDKELSREKLVLFCYCKAGEFCHRLLLKDIFMKLGAEDGGEL